MHGSAQRFPSLVIRLDGDRFKLMMDGLLLVSGLTMLGAAIRA